METAVVKRIGYKVKRKLRIVRALVPLPKPSDEQFLKDLGVDAVGLLSQCPIIFGGLTDTVAMKVLRQDRSGDIARTKFVARRALQHCFDLLGSGWVDLGQRIDWSLDFKSGKRWDQRDYRLQKLVDLSDNSDVKIPWELSRCQHFLPMAIAFHLTQDNALVTEFENQVNSWASDNQYHQTVNWSCAMDVAIRSLNWLAAYQIFSQTHSFDDRFKARLVLELYKGGRSIRENLENTGAGYNTNHYLADLIGLLYLGWLFRSIPQASDWFSLAQRELEQEMQLQVLADGLDYESSLPYHGLVTEFFFYAQQLAHRIARGFSASYSERLTLMLESLHRFTRSDGTVENFGDNDNGRLFRLCWRESRDYRDLLSVAERALPQLNLPGFVPTVEQHFCRETTTKLPRRSGKTSVLHSCLFPENGICQLRSKDAVLNFFANAVGTAGLGNHKHNDLLSFTLEYRGSPFFVDPGSFVYTVNEDVRNLFRSTRAHNTVMIDGQEQNRMVPGLLFHLRPDGRPRILDWRSEPDHDLVVAEHDCYTRLDAPVTHRRSILMGKEPTVILIRDELLGSGSHEVEFNFQLERLSVQMTNSCGLLLRHCATQPGLLFMEVDSSESFTLDTNWISPAYGTKYPALRLTRRTTPMLPQSTLFAIIPYDPAAAYDGAALVRNLRRLVQW